MSTFLGSYRPAQVPSTRLDIQVLSRMYFLTFRRLASNRDDLIVGERFTTSTFCWYVRVRRLFTTPLSRLRFSINPPHHASFALSSLALNFTCTLCMHPASSFRVVRHFPSHSVRRMVSARHSVKIPSDSFSAVVTVSSYSFSAIVTVSSEPFSAEISSAPCSCSSQNFWILR